MDLEYRQESPFSKCSRRTLGAVVLAVSILGGASLGVLSNVVAPKMAHASHQANKQTTFLINAWRFQALFVIFVTLSPVIYLYEVYIKKYEKYAEQLRFLKQRGIRLDPTKDLESQLAPENIQILTQKKQKRAGSQQERKPGSPPRKRTMA